MIDTHSGWGPMLAIFSNLRIAVKILIGIALSTALTVLVASLGVLSLQSVSEGARNIAEHDAQALRLAREVNTQQTRVEQLWLFSVIEHDRQDFEKFVREIEEANAKIDSDVIELEGLVPDSSKGEIVALRQALKDYRAQTGRIPPLWYADRLGDAEDVLQHEGKEPYAAVEAATRRISKDVDEQSLANATALAEETQSTIRTMAIVSIIGTLVIVALVLALVRFQVTGPLSAMTERMRRLAEGDTDIEVADEDRRDEIGEMARAVLVFRDDARQQKADALAKAQADAEQQQVVETLQEALTGLSGGDLTVDIKQEFPPSYAAVRTDFNGAIAKLRELISAVAESTVRINTGSQEIAAASEDLATRTESNAASLEETSAAMAQMNDRLHATAAAAKQTVGRADGAITTVAQGRKVADDAVNAMGRVSDSAEGIDSVIEGLDKIAFQTRVLAMNAAVEAGRAGEAGRGFAVVADLVSALAMRAEEEAKRVRDQLTITREEIVSAVDMVQKVDGALSNIHEDVAEVHDLLGKIAQDNEAQSSAIVEVNTAMSAMDQATQQNAAMVEETSAAARNLSSEVASLAERAATFRTGGANVAAITVTKPAQSTPVAMPPVTASADTEYQSPVKALAIGSVIDTDDWTSF